MHNREDYNSDCYFVSRVLPNFCKDRDDFVGFTCQNMQQQIADKVLEEIVKGERIISLDADPIIGSAREIGEM